MATTIGTGYANAPLKQGEPPDHGFLYTGKGLDFDGATDYITFDSITLDGDFTFATWLYIDNFNTSFISLLGANNSNHTIGFRNNNGAQFHIRMSTASSGVSTLTNAVVTGQWVRFVFTRDKSESTGKLYINGVLDHTLTAGDSGDDTNASIYTYGNIASDFVVTTISAWNNPIAYFLDCKMSDYQIWNAAWSLSDVQYAYTHPEKLATNTPGTSLTESNLKLWLPMNEGNPRSPQTTVYDAVPRQLGSELITSEGDRTFATSYGNWANYQSGTVGWDSSGYLVLDTEGPLDGESAAASGVQLAGSNITDVVVGDVVKAQFDVKLGTMADDVGGNNITGIGGGNIGFVATTSWQTVTGYFVADSTNPNLYLKAHVDNSDGGTLLFDNISLKKITGQNHGTTIFYGDELITTTNDRDFENNAGSTDTSGWTKYGAAVTNIDGGTDELQINYSDTSNSLGAEYTLPASLITGRTYRFALDIQKTDGDANTMVLYLNTAASTSITITASKVSYYRDIVATADSTNIKVVRKTDGGAASANDDEVTIDNVSVKEVGIAKGWTEADQQLDIPQTALMGGSRKMICGGDVAATDEYAETTADNAFMPAGANYSFSCWVKFDDYNQSEAGAIDDAILLVTGTNNQFRLDNDNDALKIYVNTTDSNNVVYDNAITANRWYHIVIVYDGGESGNTNRIKLYLNGSQFTATSNAGTVPTTLGNTTMKMRMGSDHIWGSNALTGIIDEVSMFTTSLSLAQSQELYNDGIPFDLVNNTLTGSPTLHGYWRNNSLTTAGTWEDLSANSFHATVTGSPDYTFFQSGLQSGRDSQGFFETHPQVGGGVLSFDGVGDYVKIPMNDTLRPKTGSVSIEFWCKTLQTGGFIFYAGTDSAAGRFVADISSNKLRAYARTTNDAGGNAVEMTGTHNSASAVNDNQWHHIVQVWDTDDAKLRMYIDGVKVFQDALTDLDGDYESLCSFLASTTDPLIIGARSATDGAFDGEIDEFKWYGRTLTDGLSGSDDTTDGLALSVTLTSGEILKNYNGSKGKHKN